MVTNIKTAVVCVVGVGYVGLPLAKAFARKLKVISYDIDKNKVKILAEQNSNPNHIFSLDPELIAHADFIAITVPTPITKSNQPDMSYVEKATSEVGRHMKKGAVIILESSVVPGTTENTVVPILEKESGYIFGSEFGVAYSPERINPGDTVHTIETITKIVAANDEITLNMVAELYSYVTPNIFKARSIKIAEAAKLVENTQRDLNIALMNELSIIFEKMGLSANDIIEAAATKWNFQKYSPGMVGGYCIPVMPCFLVTKAEEYGYHPQVILAGRALNNSMPKYVADMAASAIKSTGKTIQGSRVLVMGCTYKENSEDSRESPARELIKELQDYGLELIGYDPLVKNGEQEFKIKFINELAQASNLDCIIVTVAHDAFKSIGPDVLRNSMNYDPVLIDLRGLFDTQETRDAGFFYKRL